MLNTYIPATKNKGMFPYEDFCLTPITGLEVALLVNFKEARLVWKRVVSGEPEANLGSRGEHR